MYELQFAKFQESERKRLTNELNYGKVEVCQLNVKNVKKKSIGSFSGCKVGLQLATFVMNVLGALNRLRMRNGKRMSKKS